MNTDCIFCKILEGEIPSFCVYEDEFFKVILDRFPAHEGHALILTKQHYKDIFELPEEVAQKLYPLAKKMAIILKEVVHAEGINILQNNGKASGQAVFHFHLHLVPRKTGDNVKLNQTSNQNMTIEELEKIYQCIKEKMA
jgi:histidine triad (HIT) family protein